MAQLVHFRANEGESIGRGNEYVVIDDEDMSHDRLRDEYGVRGFELGAVVPIDGDVTAFPTERSLWPDS